MSGDDWPQRAATLEFLADLRLRQPRRPAAGLPRPHDPTVPEANVAVVGDLFTVDAVTRAIRLKRLDELDWHQRMQLKLLALRERGWRVRGVGRM